MLGKMLFLLAMGLGLLAGVSHAGEESILPMRGESPDGHVQVNQFQLQRGDTWLDDVLAAKASLPEPAEQSMEYLGWKDNCVWVTRSVAGQVLKMESDGGFGMTPRYLETPEPTTDGFFDILARELSESMELNK